MMTLEAISLPKRTWLPLFVLNSTNRIVTKLKYQKIIFLIQNDAKIWNHYNFKKHYYGPYSKELDVDTKTLSNQGLLQIKKIYGAKYPYWNFEITNKGSDILNSLLNNVSPHIKERVSNALKKYIDMNHNEITELVYSRFQLRNKKELNRGMVESYDTLKSVISYYKGIYIPECPILTYILGFSEYCLEAIKRMESKDDVMKSVIINSSNELACRFLDIANYCDEKSLCIEKADKVICGSSEPDLFEIFTFIEDYCSTNEVLPKIEDMDFSEFITMEEVKRLEMAFQTVDLS